jgi:hypothetical protein
VIKSKTIFSCLLVLFGLNLLLSSQKKPPQTPLKELTDPASRYYVPYPYPKTEFEIIDDFKYGIDLAFTPRPGKHVKIIGGDLSYRKMILGLINKKPSLKVTKIIRVEDMVVTSLCLYFFLLQIEDKNGKVVAVGSLEDCGLWAGVAFFPDSSRFRTYETKEQIKKIVADAVGPVELNKIERIGIHSSLPSSRDSPLWRISSSEGTFFVDRNDDVYLVVEEIPWSIKDNYPDPGRKRNVVLDGLQGKALFLEKVKTSGMQRPPMADDAVIVCFGDMDNRMTTRCCGHFKPEYELIDRLSAVVDNTAPSRTGLCQSTRTRKGAGVLDGTGRESRAGRKRVPEVPQRTANAAADQFE